MPACQVVGSVQQEKAQMRQTLLYEKPMVLFLTHFGPEDECYEWILYV